MCVGGVGRRTVSITGVMKETKGLRQKLTTNIYLNRWIMVDLPEKMPAELKS